MSIEKVTMYTVVCDKCGKSADEDTGYSCWSDPGIANDVASDAGFAQEGIEHYCPNCHEYDEDDNLMIKTKPL